MIGKVVKIQDPSLLCIFYPDYIIKSEINMLDRDNKIIYTGKMRPKLKEYLSANTKSFISLTGAVEEDYSNKQKLLEYVFFHQGREVPKSIAEQAEVLDDDEFNYAIKMQWVGKVWPYKHSEEDVTLYSLFKGTIDPVKDYLITYFKLLDKYPYYVVESSFLTFLQRAVTLEEQEVSPSYKRLLRTFMSKSGSKIKPAVFEYSKSKTQNELDFLNLLLGVR